MPNSFTKRTDLEKARASALASLSLREHSEFELTQKLKRKGYQPESIETIIKECLQSNYLNDLRFAEIYWRQRSQKGYGPRRIESELQQKGIDSNDIYQSSLQEELDFEKVIQKVYEKKYRNKPIADFKDKIKRQNYLYQRGFDREFIRIILAD